MNDAIGIDVSKATLDVAVHGLTQQSSFPNTAAGHRRLMKWLLALQPRQVVLEATGRYDQADAEFTGLEGEVRHEFSDLFAGSVFGDVVRAELDSGEDLPRIPATRLGARGEFHQGPWSGDLEYIRVFEQDRTADFESATPGQDLVNATAAYDFDLGPTRAQVYVRGSNLLDETVLNHASYLAETVPLRGRNFVFGVRARF